MVKVVANCFVLVLLCWPVVGQRTSFVKTQGGSFIVNGQPYYFVGANYWYGPLLATGKKRKAGIVRLRSELDFLKEHGITNVRLLGGAEGSGLLNGVTRVGPALQPSPGRFDAGVLRGLDVVLNELAKRDMKAVIFISNNWEWSGGFQQYLIWNGVVSKDLLTRKPSWDELRDIVAKFYSCAGCKKDYEKQLRYLVTHRNSISGRRYADDATIMAWELANEPRPMRPAANQAYKEWIRDTARLIKKLDRNHLVSTGHEGRIGTESLELFKEVHANPEIDYATIHIWPKNWGWFTGSDLEKGLPEMERLTRDYILEHRSAARALDKPLVIEEFGLPRDAISFSPSASTLSRDQYFNLILAFVGPGAESGIAGANFWAFGGTARPHPGQPFWKPGDPYMGDPPMEEQGLNTVFDSDKTTWRIISSQAKRLLAPPQRR